MSKARKIHNKKNTKKNTKKKAVSTKPVGAAFSRSGSGKYIDEGLDQDLDPEILRAHSTSPSMLEALPSFDDLAERAAEMQAAFADAQARLAERKPEHESLELAFVARLDRGYPVLVSKHACFRAEFSATMAKPYRRVTLGDWVLAERLGHHTMGILHELLPRTNELTRWRGGKRGETQALAANLDTILIVQSLGSDHLSFNRIARSCVVALDCKLTPCVVLTKADRVTPEELLNIQACLTTILGEKTPLVSCTIADSKTGVPRGLGAVKTLVPAGTVALLFGESGAGKSSLLNALMGKELLKTSAVRDSDDAGRHTTVARRMVKLPGAGIIADVPGIRSLPLVGHERGLHQFFSEIHNYADACKFRDCTHQHEPGCAVQAALTKQLLHPEQLSIYRQLLSEMTSSAQSIDPDIHL